MQVSAIWFVTCGIALQALTGGSVWAMPANEAHPQSHWRRVAAAPEASSSTARGSGSPSGLPDNYNFTGKNFDFSLTKKPRPKDKPDPKDHPDGSAPETPKPAESPKPAENQKKSFLDRSLDGTLDLFGLGT